MSDYCYAKLEVGPVPENKRAGLLAAINDDGAVGAITEDSIDTWEDLERNGYEIQDEQARNGGFKAAESYLLGNQQTFDRYTSAVQGCWDPHWVLMREGMYEPAHVPSDSSQRMLLDVEEVVAIRDRLNQLLFTVDQPPLHP